MLKSLYEKMGTLYDPAAFRNNTLKISELEKTVCHRDFGRSTAYIMQLMRESGFEDVERIEHPADGVTTVGDSTMPEAWDLTGRSTLKVLSDWEESGRIIADTDETVLAAATWCGHTGPEGATGELIRYDAAHPERAKGKWVLYDGLPGGVVNQPLARAGALGIVSTDLAMGKFNPDGTRWMNGQGLWGWYYLKGEPRIPIFAITARRALKLMAKLDAGEKVLLHGVMNTRTYDGVVYTVTGRIPGESSDELALIAHMYEPFASDDASGVAEGIEIGRMLKASGIKLKKSLRVVFVMEHYSTKFYFLTGKHHIKAALNLDDPASLTYKRFHYPLEWRLSPLCMPFFGDLLMLRISECCEPAFRINPKPGNLSDDSFGSDPMMGIPTEWLWVDCNPHHHFSDPIFADVDWDVGGVIIRMIAVYAAVLLGAEKETWEKLAPELIRIALLPLSSALTDSPYARKVHCDFAAAQIESMNAWVPGLKLEAEPFVRYFRLPGADWEVSNPAEEEASRMVITRNLPCVPWSFARIPYEKKRRMSLNRLQFALLDGKRTLLETVRMVEAVGGMKRPTEEELKQMMSNMRFLEEYGYLTITML